MPVEDKDLALLTPIAQNGVSMSRIESRPARARASMWEYVFFIDLEGHVNDPKVAATVEQMRRRALQRREGLRGIGPNVGLPIGDHQLGAIVGELEKFSPELAARERWLELYQAGKKEEAAAARSDAMKALENALAAAKTNNAPAPTALPDPEAEALRQILYAADSPAVIPDDGITNTEQLFTTKVTEELWKLQGEVDRHLIRSPASPSSSSRFACAVTR